jgi:hypothetical protein
MSYIVHRICVHRLNVATLARYECRVDRTLCVLIIYRLAHRRLQSSTMVRAMGFCKTLRLRVCFTSISAPCSRQRLLEYQRTHDYILVSIPTTPAGCYRAQDDIVSGPALPAAETRRSEASLTCEDRAPVDAPALPVAVPPTPRIRCTHSTQSCIYTPVALESHLHTKHAVGPLSPYTNIQEEKHTVQYHVLRSIFQIHKSSYQRATPTIPAGRRAIGRRARVLLKGWEETDHDAV